MTTARSAAALATALLALAAWAGTAQAAGPLDDPAFPKVITCSACHGANGNSKVDMMPIIAGLDPAYFKRQIENYATGKRPSPEMEPYAKEIQFLGLDQIAAYFAAQKRLPTPIRAQAEAAARGKQIAAQCVICHGPEGRGDRAKLIPYLAGQPPGYLKNQMMLFREDKRSPGDPSLKAIKELMKSLSDDTMSDLAAYYSSVR